MVRMRWRLVIGFPPTWLLVQTIGDRWFGHSTSANVLTFTRDSMC